MSLWLGASVPAKIFNGFEPLENLTISDDQTGFVS